jgi:hypothetical protein
MAIGLSLMFNVRLPLNFDSPYKAKSIIEFWRSWHMTLSRFLKDYLYIPLGGSRFGSTRRYTNLVITMLLGGLWHGAGWTFIIWGALHGIYLLINHAWRGIKVNRRWGSGGRVADLGSGVLTFIAVIVGWVFFRSDSYSSSVTILQGMAGMHGISVPATFKSQLTYIFGMHSWLVFSGWGPFGLTKVIFELSIGFFIVWFLPNINTQFRYSLPMSYQSQIVHSGIFSEENKSIVFKKSAMEWQPTKWIAFFMGGLFLISILIVISGNKSEFLYFQF